VTQAERIAHLRRSLDAAGLPVDSLVILTTNDAGRVPRVVGRGSIPRTYPLFDELSDDA
jgi:hypothetical protein